MHLKKKNRKFKNKHKVKLMKVSKKELWSLKVRVRVMEMIMSRDCYDLINYF